MNLLFGKTTQTTTTETTTRNADGINRVAFCMGLNNYPGTSNDLKGCVNDAKNWANILKNNYQFNNVLVALDNEMTKKNVVSKINNLSKDLKLGDIFVITYSGHGTSVPDQNGDEADGRDEAWCLYDGTFIDDDIRNIVAKLPNGVKLTIISDSCHSGTVTRAFMGTMSDSEVTPKYLPPTDDIDAVTINAVPIMKSIFYPEENMSEILISGCLPTEYSYDARINGSPTGAFSYHALKILKENGKITYNDFYKKLRKELPSSRYPQTPCLEGSKANKNSIMFE